jgi:DNA end-binding protein Ku
VKPIWKGHISFGLVNVPVTLYPAEQRTDLSLHMIDSRDFSRVRYERVNAETGEEVPWGDVVKGFEYAEGSYVVIGQEELKKAAPEATKMVEIESFVELKDIDFMYFDRPYYLEPTKAGQKGYALLRDVLAETGKVGIARVVIRTRQYMAAMVPVREALMLNLLRFEQELRTAEGLELPGDSEKIGVSKREIKMARDLVESMSDAWDPSKFHDEYREKLMEWIESRIESGDVQRVAEPPEDGEEDAPAPISIMDALKKSLERSGEGAGGSAKKAGKKASRKSAKKPAKKAARPTRKKAG